MSTLTLTSPTSSIYLKDSLDCASLTTTNSGDGEDCETYYLSNGKICSDNFWRSRADIEHLAERLFSLDHLKLILSWPPSFARFRTFLSQYRPQLAVVLRQYLDVQKALAAVKYANALADHLWPGLEAAVVEEAFESRLFTASQKLLNDALPSYVTYKATELVRDVLVKEMTGQSIPALKDMVNGLADRYCLTDPSQPNNPIVYASDEFFEATLYPPPEAIGKSCCFMRGPKTSAASISRIMEAMSEGKQLCETVLNYRRDGSPVLNLILIAPLYDTTGKVRFYLGAQIDVNGVFEDGRGLQSLAQLLARDRSDAVPDNSGTRDSVDAVAELGRLLNDNERHAIVKSDNYSIIRQANGGRGKMSVSEPDDIRTNNTRSSPTPATLELERPDELISVFQNYVLVSPAPTLKIAFASASLTTPALINSPFLSRVRGPRKLRQSVEQALYNGECFTAKISWLSDISTACCTNVSSVDGARSQISPTVSDRTLAAQYSDNEFMQVKRVSLMRKHNEQHGKLTWIHCTPLFDEKGRVGVWMIVLVRGEGGRNTDGTLRDRCLSRK